jgi:sulfofructose kinase
VTRRVNCVGVGVLDLIYRVDALPAGEGKVLADQLVEVGGGMAANAAVTVARMGGAARWFGRLGQDELGDRILAGVAMEGVDVSSVLRVSEMLSSHSIVLVDAQGRRLILLYRPTNLPADPGWIDLDLLLDCDVVLTDIRWPEGAAHTLRAARDRGVPGVLDADIAEVGSYGLPVALASHVIFSRDGLRQAAGCDDVTEALRRIAARSSAFIAVTLGERGAAWLQDGALRTLPALPVVVRDTLGAGDVFHGAFALGLAEGRSVEAALHLASAAAAVKCSRTGGREGIPSRQDVDRLIAGWMGASDGQS